MRQAFFEQRRMQQRDSSSSTERKKKSINASNIGHNQYGNRAKYAKMADKMKLKANQNSNRNNNMGMNQYGTSQQPVPVQQSSYIQQPMLSNPVGNIYTQAQPQTTTYYQQPVQYTTVIQPVQYNVSVPYVAQNSGATYISQGQYSNKDVTVLQTIDQLLARYGRSQVGFIEEPQLPRFFAQLCILTGTPQPNNYEQLLIYARQSDPSYNGRLDRNKLFQLFKAVNPY